MKTRLLLLALVPLLLGGCGSGFQLSLNPVPTVVRPTGTSVLTVGLKNGTGPWMPTTKVTLKSDNAALTFTPVGSPPSTPRKDVEMITGATSTKTLVAGMVDHDTEVTIDGEWHRTFIIRNVYASTTVTVRPPIVDSQQYNGNYINVDPSVVPAAEDEWTYTYVITGNGGGSGSPLSLVSCNLKLQVDARVTATGISAQSGQPIGIIADPWPNTEWFIHGGVNFASLIITVTTKQGKPGGTASINCHGADNHDYVTTATGPMRR